MLTHDDVRNHYTRASCWVVISGQAYDVTEFLDDHPGGADSILRLGGTDATQQYEPIHAPGLLEKHLPADKHLGPVSGMLASNEYQQLKHRKPSQQTPLPLLQNLDDFEIEARKLLPQKAWVYYSSAADSLSSHHVNRRDFGTVVLRPRILRNVARVSMKRRIMGHDSALPVYIAPAAMAKLGHEDGELCLARGAARYNIPYCSSTYSSVAHEDLAACLAEEDCGGALLFQLYVPTKKENAKVLIATARRLGFKALVLTVDSAVIGKREEDERYKAELDQAAGIDISRTHDTSNSNAAPVLRGAHSSTLDWSDLAWIKSEWADAGPIVLKGIQTVEDAVLAAREGLDGIYLSNHGGRQLDYAPSSLQTLLEIRRHAPHLIGKIDIYLDGGVRRGTDIIKAIALGAQGVGLGRPFMYALSGYGTDGVLRALEILDDELQTAMRLMGVTDLSQLRDFHVNSSALELEVAQRIDAVGMWPSKL